MFQETSTSIYIDICYPSLIEIPSNLKTLKTAGNMATDRGRVAICVKGYEKRKSPLGIIGLTTKGEKKELENDLS